MIVLPLLLFVSAFSVKQIASQWVPSLGVCVGLGLEHMSKSGHGAGASVWASEDKVSFGKLPGNFEFFESVQNAPRISLKS